MDHTEDLSARVLLKQILSTEEPRTPITRSASRSQSSSSTRCSNRLSKKDAGGQTPQAILRRSLKHKMRESITRKSLPATTRKTRSSVSRKANTPGPASMLFDDADTPRHILRNIVLTEPVRSPVVHKRPASEGPQLLSANSSIASKRPSIEISVLDLPDLTIAAGPSTVKGLSRKRPRRSLNVTAFEKRLKDGNDVEEENEASISDHSSLSLSSSASLSLKTPFMDVRTEKKGLQRKVGNRRKITEEEFGAAVDGWQTGTDHGLSSCAPVEKGLNETTCPEGFTLGLSELSEPDITADIVNCNTALYSLPDATASTFLNVATQDKPTVMSSQLQRLLEAEQSKLRMDTSGYAFPTEEADMAEPQSEECDPKLHLEKDEEAQIAEEGPAHPGDVASRCQSEENDVVPDSQTEGEEEAGDDSQPEEDAAARSQSEEEEGLPDSQTEEEEEEKEEEEVAAETQTEEEEEKEEEVAADSQTEEEEEEEEEEEVAAETQNTEVEDGAVDSQSEEDGDAKSQPEEDRDLTESQAEDDHDGNQEEGEVEQASEQLEHDLEHISRRAQRSEGRLVVPVTEAGWSGDKSEGLGATDLRSSLETGGRKSSQTQAGMSDLVVSSMHGQEDASCTEEAQPDADKENSSSHDIEDGDDLHGASAEEAAAEAPAEQEEEWEDENDDEETEELPLKTPAFVRAKRNFFQQDPQASPVLKTIQVSHTSKTSPTAKPKQVQRKRRTAKKDGGLPKNYLMGVFKHFAKTKVSADVYPVLTEIMDKFFDRLANDLETYAAHAKRRTIDVEDAVLLLKRQGYVNDKVPVEVLIEKHLRMEQRKLLIPIATSGNVVIPKKRR